SSAYRAQAARGSTAPGNSAPGSIAPSRPGRPAPTGFAAMAPLRPGARGSGGQPGADAPHRPGPAPPPGPSAAPASPGHPAPGRATSRGLLVLPLLVMFSGLVILLGPLDVWLTRPGLVPLPLAPLRAAPPWPAPLPLCGSAPAGARVRPGSSWAQTAWR